MSAAELITHFEQFKGEQSLTAREALVRSICTAYDDGEFSSKEREIIKEILNFLSRDIEATIRKALAETLKESNDLPHEVAVRLAKDVEEVATPILEFSAVLNDDDLDAIIQSTERTVTLTAIARRKMVSSRVSLSLVNKENADVVKTLVSNKNANLGEQALDRVLDVFKDSEDILGTLVNRGDLSPQIAERMVSMVSSALKKELTFQYGLNARVVKHALRETREKMALGIIRNASNESTTELVNHLYNSGKLTHSIVLRALCRADFQFFETGIAKLAGISKSNAHKLIHQGNSRGFRALFHAASMPPTMLEATEILVKTVLEEEALNVQGCSKSYAKHLLERISSNGYDKKVPNMSYFMALIGSCASEAADTSTAH